MFISLWFGVVLLVCAFVCGFLSLYLWAATIDEPIGHEFDLARSVHRLMRNLESRIAAPRLQRLRQFFAALKTRAQNNPAFWHDIAGWGLVVAVTLFACSLVAFNDYARHSDQSHQDTATQSKTSASTSGIHVFAHEYE
jgi:hypothetical protein